MSKPNPAAGKYQYKAGVCINPDMILDHTRGELNYQLYVSQCNVGWCAGLHYFDGDQYELEIKCAIESGVFSSRDIASKEIAQTLLHLLTGMDKNPVITLLKKLGNVGHGDESHDHEKDLSNLSTTNIKSMATTKPAAEKAATGKVKSITLSPKMKEQTDELDIKEIKAGDIIEVEFAAIKDEKCNYKYKIVEGSQPGFRHQVDGIGIAEESMIHAWDQLKVYLAAYDDVFKLSDIPVKKIDKMHTHELTLNYHVSAFKVSGTGDEMTVILTGDKFVSSGGRMALITPKINLDKSSTYKFGPELKDAIDLCCREVVLYHQGNYTLPVSGDDMDEHGDVDGLVNDNATPAID